MNIYQYFAAVGKYRVCQFIFNLILLLMTCIHSYCIIHNFIVAHFLSIIYKSDTSNCLILHSTSMHYSVADNKWHVSERNGYYILLIGHYIGTLGFHECD